MRDFRGQTERNGEIRTQSSVPSCPLDSTRFDLIRGEMMEAEGEVSRVRVHVGVPRFPFAKRLWPCWFDPERRQVH